MLPDENTRLLERSSSLQKPSSRGDSPGPGSSNKLKRPPLIAIPTSQSIRSLRSINNVNDFLVNSYISNKNKNSYSGRENCATDELDESIFKSRFWNKLNRVEEDDLFDLYSYLSYYCPILKWLPNYNARNSFLGDFLAGLSLASFQIPLVMSFSLSLARLSPVSGLYGIIIGACVYSVLGCVPVLIVGPLPSTALIYGDAIEAIRQLPNFADISKLQISSAISAAMSGILLGAGIFRMGFLDNVLSRALLKGFIAAMGFIMIINELATEMGIDDLILDNPYLTTLEKFTFICKFASQSHTFTLLISCITLALVLSIRNFKNTLVNKYNIRQAVFIPELFLMVLVATYLCWRFLWHTEYGVDVVGNILTAAPDSKSTVQFINPFKLSLIPLYKKAFSTSFLCTILGYFDSTIATKALGTKYNYNVSSNRELIALGATNFVISLVGGIPAFGAFGRSKINILSGATTQMAGIMMSIVVILVIIYLLPLLYSLPKCVLALSTTIIGITVLEEVPSDLKFFWDIGGYDEIITFLFIFSTTILWNAEAGVLSGVAFAIIRVIKHSTRSRIQILGRVPNTTVFRNADELIEESFVTYANDYDSISHEEASIATEDPDDKLTNLIAEIEEIEGVLVIKIPEPLNFANVGDLKNRLSRIEKYGSLLVHPSQPTRRDFNNTTIKFIIFDCKGMNAIDSSATQILYETIKKYIEINEIFVCFSRVAMNKNIRHKFKKLGIIDLVNDNYKTYANANNVPSKPAAPENGNSTNLYSYGTSSGMEDGFFLSIEEAIKAFGLQNV